MKSIHVLQDDDIPGIVRYRTYEVLKEEVKNQALRWAYLPYAMHMAGPREAIQHMIIRKNYGTQSNLFITLCDGTSMHSAGQDHESLSPVETNNGSAWNNASIAQQVKRYVLLDWERKVICLVGGVRWPVAAFISCNRSKLAVCASLEMLTKDWHGNRS